MNILSVQSHVVYGHVGNSAAVFPLQRLGHEVWALHTVSYSNHPKHGQFRGRTSSADQLQELIAGLDDLGSMARCDAVLTGYLGDVTVGQIIVDTVQSMRAQNPDVVFCCDPVMGHEQDGFFVPGDLQTLFRDTAVPMADIVTPNQFELEYLAGRSLPELSDAVQACVELHKQGPEHVVVTSLAVREVSDQQIGTLVVGPDGAWLVTTPRLSGDLFGAGDLFAALFLGNFLADRSVPMALASSVAATYGILKATVETGVNELEIIRAQDEIVLPSQFFEVTQLA